MFCGTAGGWSGAPAGFDGLYKATKVVFKGDQILQREDNTSADDGVLIDDTVKQRSGIRPPVRKCKRGQLTRE